MTSKTEKGKDKVTPPIEYMWRADYMLAPVKQELRQEAIAQGLIHGVASDYQVQQSQQPTYTS